MNYWEKNWRIILKMNYWERKEWITEKRMEEQKNNAKDEWITEQRTEEYKNNTKDELLRK